MITYLIYSTLSLGILLLIYRTVLIKEKMYHFNRGYLLFSLVFSLTIPLVPVGIFGDFLMPHEISEISAPSSVQNSESVEVYPFIDGESYQTNAEAGSGAEGLFTSLLIGIYVIVVLILFVRLLRIIHMIQVRADRNPSTLFEGLEVVLLSENVVPHTFLSTIYVNKKRFESGKTGRDVLLHEAAHAKQKHSIDILFVEFLKIIFWFNPLLYYYKKAIHLNHEFLADDAVLKSGVSTIDYQKTLLQTLLHKPTCTLASSIHFGLTKMRFQMMNKSINKLKSVMKILSLIPLFLVMALFLGCESTPADAERSAKEIIIEMTDSEMIILNGEKMDVSELDGKLQELSVNDELHFTVKEHPEMKRGPFFKVNSLIQHYTDPKENHGQSLVQIKINEESEIIANGKTLTLDELKSFLDEKALNSSHIIDLRVNRNSEFQTILDVQKVLRVQDALRINYSVYKGKDDSGSNLYPSQTLTLPPIPPSAITRQEISDAASKKAEVIDQNDLLTILINAQGMILANDQPETISSIKNRVKSFVGNYGSDPGLSLSPKSATLAIKTDRHTEYETYREILDEILAAYNDLWDEVSRERFGVPFSSLAENSEEYREIREAYPKRISIVKPD